MPIKIDNRLKTDIGIQSISFGLFFRFGAG